MISIKHTHLTTNQLSHIVATAGSSSSTTRRLETPTSPTPSIWTMASPSSRITVSEYPNLPTGQGVVEEVSDVSEEEHSGEQGHEEEVSIEGTDSNNTNTTSVNTPNSVNLIVSGEQVAIDSSTRNTATSKDGTSFTVPACMFDLTSNEPNINTANDIQTTQTASNDLSSAFNRAAQADPKTTGGPPH